MSAPMSRTGSRWSRWVSYEAPLSQTALGVWYVFAISACATVAMLPFMVFMAVVGWQPSHLAIWLCAITSFPAAPVIYALLDTADRLVAEREYPGNPLRYFARSLGAGWARLRGLWLAVPALVLFLSYDAALLGGQATVAVVVALVLLAVITLAASVVAMPAEGECETTPTGVAPLHTTLHTAVTATLRRPHIVLTWVFLGVIAMLMTRIPAIGPSLLLFIPAVWAGCVSIVNRTWGFAS